MKIYYSPRCLEYGSLSHPENYLRVKNSIDFIKEKILKEKHNWQILEPQVCSDDDLFLVHSKELVETIRAGTFSDPDTPNYDGIFDIATLAAGGAINAMHSALDGEIGFSLMRPPGHHAGRNFLGGFCYFNNIAIAVAKALESGEMKRIVIIDFDLHHGNGTQDIFLENSKNVDTFSNNTKWKDKVLYISLHQSPCYPGTGLNNIKNCLNFPLRTGTNSKQYLEIFEIVLDKIRNFNPDMIAISAGFDTYKNDSLGSLELELYTYYEIGKKISSLQKKTFAVLEGGYSDELRSCIWNFMKGLNNL